jgi:hypothetical protein
MFCCATVSVASSGSAFFDHDMTLPTPTLRPDRLFRGQRFCRSLATDAIWRPWRVPGFVARGTGIGDATGGVASVYLARPDRADRNHAPLRRPLHVRPRRHRYAGGCPPGRALARGRRRLRGVARPRDRARRRVFESGPARSRPARCRTSGLTSGLTSVLSSSLPRRALSGAARSSPCSGPRSAIRGRRPRAICPLPPACCRCGSRRGRRSGCRCSSFGSRRD